VLRPARGRLLLWRQSSAPTAPAPASALPRPQLSRRDWRTAASARRCTSRAARGRRHPPRYCFSAASADPLGPERSSRVGRPRDRFARKALARPVRAGRALRHDFNSRVDDMAATARRSPDCALDTSGGGRRATGSSSGCASAQDGCTVSGGVFRGASFAHADAVASCPALASWGSRSLRASFPGVVG
jgi:hypothetical protein